MPGASAINQVEDKGFQVTPLLIGGDPTGWNELETIDFINEIPQLSTQAGERSGVKTTMMALEREQAGKQQRVVVIGDADAFSMGEVMANRRGILSANVSFIICHLISSRCQKSEHHFCIYEIFVTSKRDKQYFHICSIPPLPFYYTFHFCTLMWQDSSANMKKADTVWFCLIVFTLLLPHSRL